MYYLDTLHAFIRLYTFMQQENPDNVLKIETIKKFSNILMLYYYFGNREMTTLYPNIIKKMDFRRKNLGKRLNHSLRFLPAVESIFEMVLELIRRDALHEVNQQYEHIQHMLGTQYIDADFFI